MNSILIDNITERTVQLNFIGEQEPLPVQKVGDALNYFDEIYNADGETIGHAVGWVLATHLAPNGHLMTHYEHAAELPDGTLRAGGTVDRQDMIEGRLIVCPAIGTGGKFLGLSGVVEWQLILPNTTMTVNMRIRLG
jgi:hypothetical protein